MKHCTEYELFAMTKDDLIEHINQLYQSAEYREEFITLAIDVLWKVKKIEKFYKTYLEEK